MALRNPPGPPMTLGNMRKLGVQRLIAFCLNDAYRHQGLIDVSNYADDVDVPFFATKVVCANAALVHIDVRPNWKEHRVTGGCCICATAKSVHLDNGDGAVHLFMCVVPIIDHVRCVIFARDDHSLLQLLRRTQDAFRHTRQASCAARF
jgi:hypothetical protein